MDVASTLGLPPRSEFSVRASDRNALTIWCTLASKHTSKSRDDTADYDYISHAAYDYIGRAARAFCRDSASDHSRRPTRAHD
eukprot:260585-Pleurochrysis_carterae.AAC.1